MPLPCPLTFWTHGLQLLGPEIHELSGEGPRGSRLVAQKGPCGLAGEGTPGQCEQRVHRVRGAREPRDGQEVGCVRGVKEDLMGMNGEDPRGQDP